MPQLFLNERSCETKADPDRVNRAMTDMVRAVLAVAREDRAGTLLVSAEPVTALQLAQGHAIQKWIGSPGTRDLWQRLAILQSKWPHREAFPEGETHADVEYRHDGDAVEGLGAAHLTGGLGISLPVEPRWDTDRLTLVREELVDDEDGGSALTEADVVHAARREHVATHLPWIRRGANTARQKAVESLRSGTELWARCPELFPLLQFTPLAEQHFAELAEVWVRPVGERLGELQDAVSDWDPVRQPIAPRWRSYVRTEFESRRRLCWFPDTDGENRLFDWHCDFLPKPGRMHFRLVHEERTLRIAYAGRKLDV
ncbi:hypothetical protein AMK21_15275 [Streptomyces sp. CB00316]|uniref:hypothetical protein n=1 Tax=unclassified Streptomyces TaxID=2593676 RepID=UPI000939B179|nr:MULTISPECIES: hypothetical protein [unclassified Streptomyces]MBT2428719.1 hypothetical protein [Streptomyces sp. ISL-112]MBT2461135.1 hypothetical protein [Streptomyces sp. ISL-63]OKJ19713.1 hypothetical protein AMK21_15275 [Streptomyces sp. CB00316]